MQTTEIPNQTAVSQPFVSIVLTVIWLCAVGLGAYFLYTSALAYRNFDEETYGADYLWPMRFWAAGHIVGGTIAMVAGAIQLVPVIRNRYSSVHRWLPVETQQVPHVRLLRSDPLSNGITTS
jgi:hypothetical protein